MRWQGEVVRTVIFKRQGPGPGKYRRPGGVKTYHIPGVENTYYDARAVLVTRRVPCIIGPGELCFDRSGSR